MSSLRSPRRSIVAVVIAALVGAVTVVATAQTAQAAAANCTPDSGYTNCQVFAYDGTTDTFTVPAGVNSVLIKAWGAGGGGVNNTNYAFTTAGGGAGGYATGTLAVTPAQQLQVIAGQGGAANTTGSSPSRTSFGGGAAGGAGGTTSTSPNNPVIGGSSGGGLSGVFTATPAVSTAAVVAGGGGGGSPGADTNSPYAGGGGGTTGGQDALPAQSGRGGTQAAGGAGATTTTGCATAAGAGSALAGGAGSGVTAGLTAGTPEEGGGGGGGGYYGGGGGRCQYVGGTPNGDGGGGSSYTAGTGVTGGATTAGGNSSAGVGGTAPNKTDAQYVAGVATGGGVSTSAATYQGGNGQVVIEWNVNGVVGNFQCSNNSIYAVDGVTAATSSNITKVSTTTGAETLIGTVDTDAGTNLNGLAITNGGAYAYAINRNVTSNGATTIYRFDPNTGTTTKYAGPTVTLASGATTANIVEGAIDPKSGIYYFAYIDANGLEIYGFDTGSNTPISGELAHIAGVTGGNGDFAFDRLGRLVLTASSGNNTASANPLLYVSAPLPTTGGANAALTAKTISYLTPNDSTFNGLAFGLPEGYLYVDSLSGTQSTLRQLDPDSGAQIASYPVTSPSGAATGEISDLASCTYNNSIQVQKNIVGRVNPSDQFTVSVSGSGLAALTGTTSGTGTGLQANSTATAGPAPVLAGDSLTISETPGNTTTNLSKYISTYQCTNEFTGNAVPGLSGTGTSATITFPTPTDANGIPLNCVFTNTPISSGISITKTADKPAYRSGQTVTYTITVTNTGNSTLTGVAVADATDSACVKNYASLAAGATQTYTCTATAPVTGNSNTATVSAKDPSGATVTGTSTVAVPTINPSLQLTKSASPTTVTAAGQSVTYSFLVKNTGDSTITALSIADTATAPAGTPTSITCPVTSLASGASTTCTGTYTATQADVDNGSIIDSAVANGTDASGAAVASNTSTATVTVTQNPALTLVKAATPTTVAAVGSTVSYSFTVTNTGNVTVTGIKISDAFDNASVVPPTITCPSTTLAPGAAVRCTATYAATQSDFDQGSINNTATASGTAPGGKAVNSPSSTASVTASTAPSLSLTKSASPTSISKAGQTVTYTFKVTNTGNQTLNGLGITDTFTAPALASGLSSITCPQTTLAPGASTNCTATYTASQADADKGTITNAATASAKTAKGTAVTSAQSTATVTITPAAALTITKSASPTTITAAGTSIAYSFLVANTGNVTVNNIVVADNFGGAGTAPTVTCPVTSLTPGTNTTCTATYTATQADVDAGSISNTATVSGKDPNGTGVTSPSSTATVSVTRTSALTLTKSASVTSVSAVGQSITYTFAVKNTGNQTLTGLAINDQLTAPASPVPAITCPTTTLAPGASTNCTGTYKATQADLDNGTINNSATAVAKDPTGATITSPASTATVTASTTATLTLSKTASPATYSSVGQTINYSFLVTNTGTSTISNVAITDPMFTGAAAPTCATRTLAPGASVTCTASYKTTQNDIDTGKIVNTATASGTNPKGGAVTSGSSSATVTASQSSSLLLTKSATPASIRTAGDQITYSFAVTNTGNTTVTGLAINDALASPATGTLTITCPVTTLAPNASTTCTSSAYTSKQADIDAGGVSNSATATAQSPTKTAVTSNTSTAFVPSSTSTRLTLTKTANPTTVTAAGQTVAYSFAVTNSSNVTVTGLKISDVLASPALAGNLTTISCPVTTLAPNASTTCTATYTATQADIDNGSIKNSATASAAGPTGTAVTSNASAVTVTAPAASAMTVTKTASPTKVTAAGQTVNYSFVVADTGNTTLSNVAVADTFTAPAGPAITPSCPSTTITPGTSVTCTASYKATQADVDNGSIINSAIASATDPSGKPVQSPTSTAVVTAPATEGLTVTKSASPTTASTVGQQITYTITATNTGNTTLSLLNVKDTMSAPSGAASAPNCPSTTVAPGASVACTVTYTVTQADIDNGSITNTASASATDPKGNTVSAPSTTATVTTTSTKSLSLVKSASPSTITGVGQPVTYTFTVKNTGSSTVTNLVINDTFTAPAGPALSPITCSATTLAPNATTTCTAGYTSTQADVTNGSINNSATATGASVGGPVTSNTSTATVAVTQTPKLTLGESANPTSITTAGTPITFTYTVTNSGNVPVSGIALSDPRYTTAPTCNATSLQPGASTTCTGTYTATQADVDAGKIVDTATATGTAPGSTPVTSNQSQATVTATLSPTLTITKTASPSSITSGALGSKVTYTFGITNTGNVTVHGVNVVDRFTAPAGPPLSPITCTATTLAPNASTSCTATYTVTQQDVDKGSIANTATAAGLDPGNNAVGSAPASATVTIAQNSALTMTKSANPTAASKAGQQVTYTFTATNTGNTTLTGLSIADQFSAPAGPALTGITCVATTLAPGAVTTCSATYTITQADVDNGSITNSATASATDPTNKTITSTSSAATVTIAPGAAIGLTETASPATYSGPNATITYTYTVTNTGTNTVSGISIIDPRYTSANSPVCAATTLTPGASTTCTGTYTTTQNDVDAGSIVDTAIASGLSPTGKSVLSPQSTATVTAQQSPALKLVKSASPQTVTSIGDPISYTFAVSNVGNVTLGSINVTDTFATSGPSAMAVYCPDASLFPGQSETCSLSYASTTADFANGQINNTAVAHGTPPSGTVVDSNPSSASVTASQSTGLSLVKSASPTTVTAAGQQVTYNFAVSNNGNVALTNVAVKDTFTAPAGPEINPVCAATSLAVGASTNCTATYTATQNDIDAGSINNSAVATATGPNGTVTSPKSTATVTSSAPSGLTLSETGAPATVSTVGQNVTFTYTVTNNGAVTVNGVAISDPRYSAATTPTCAATSLAPGASTTCTGTYATTQADLDNGKIVDTATATGTDAQSRPVSSNPASATVGTTQSPSLTVTKTATPPAGGVTKAGNQVGYTIVVANNGNVTVTNVAVTDNLAAPAGPSPALSCPTSTTLAPNTSLTCTATYTASQNDIDNGSITNTANATAVAPNGTAVTPPSSTATVPTSPSASLSLVKSVSPTTGAVLGQQLSYSFLVTNTGTSTINGIKIVDTVSAPATPTPTVSCPVTTLAPGANTTCTARYTIKQADVDAGGVSNSATATGTGPGGAAVTSSPSTATATVPQTSSLSLVKSASPTTVSSVGQQVTYSFQVTNTGTTTLNGVSVADAFTSPSTATLAVSCPATTLAPNATTTCTATYAVTQADLNNGSVTNSATASGKPLNGAAVTSSPSTATVAVTASSGLGLTTVASPSPVTAVGQTVTYTYTVTNNGTVTVNNPTVTTSQQAPAGTVTAGKACPTGPLAPGASVTCTVTYVATQADVDNGSIVSTATATATDPKGAQVSSTPVPTTVPVAQQAALGMTKSVSPTSFSAVGQSLTYTFTLTNNGNVTLNAFAINDTLAAPAAPQLNPITCPTSLAPATTATCTAKYIVTQNDLDGGSVANTAFATAKAPAGNSVTSNTSTAVSSATQSPVLSLVKSVTPNSITAAGQTVTYNFALTNNGNVTLSNPSILDTFTAPAGPAVNPTCPATIAPGATVSCTAKYVASQADVDQGSITNNAVASASTPSGATVNSGSSTATVGVASGPSLSLVKSADVTTVSTVGRSINYSFKVTNTGNKTISGLTIVDKFTAPAGPGSTPSCPVTTLAPGASTTCTSSYAVTAGDVDKGSISNSAVATGSDPSGATITSPPSAYTVTVTQSEGLQLAETGTVTDVNNDGVNDLGDTITYTYTVTNTGNRTLSGLSVTGSAGGPTSCVTTTLTAGASTTCTSNTPHTISQADVDAGKVVDVATATAKDSGGTTVTSNQTTVTTPVASTSSLALKESVSPATITSAGTSVTFSYQVTNTGTTTVSGIAVADTSATPAGQPTPVSCPTTTLTPGTSVTCTATYTSTQADVDNGSITNTSTATGTSPSGTAVTSNQSSAAVTATAGPALTIVKSASPTALTAAGQTVNYLFTVTNSGNVTVSGLAVADTFAAPASTTATPACQTTTLTPGAKTTCTLSYTATQADVNNGKIVNSATASATTKAGAAVSAQSNTVTVTIAPSPALSISTSTTPTSVTAMGQTITYTYTVTNTGNVTQTGVGVGVSVAPPGSTQTTPVCTATTLNPGDQTTCTSTYTVSQADIDNGTITSTATATGTPSSGGTSSSSPSTTVVSTTGTPTLQLTETANPTTVSTLGAQVSYTFKVTNTGTLTVNNVTVQDTFSGPAGPALSIKCPTSPLAPGAVAICMATYTVTQADIDNGTIKDVSVATGTTSTGSVTSNTANATVVATQNSALTIVKSASPMTITKAGDQVTYSFQVTNSGNTTVTGVAVNDTFTAPAGPALSVSCPTNSLLPSGVETCTGTYTATQADIDHGSIANSATASGTGPGNTAVTSSSSMAMVTATPTGALTVTVSPTPTTVSKAGDQVTYTYTVTNGENTTVTGIGVTNTLGSPAGTGSTPICQVTSLAPGASTTCTSTYTATQNDIDHGSINGTVSASGTQPGGAQTTSAPVASTVGVASNPSIAMTKSASPTTVTAVGNKISYSFQVTNSGNLTLNSVGISDPMFAGANAPNCPSTTLAPGTSTTCTASYTVTQADLDRGSVTNTATAAGTTLAGAVVTSPKSSATVSTVATGSLTITKSALPTTIGAAGTTVTYTFVVTNGTNVTVGNIAIQDSFSAPAGPAPSLTNANCPTSLAAGASGQCQVTYTSTQKDVDNGSITNSATVTGTNALGTALASTPSTATVAVVPTSGLTTVVTPTPGTVSTVGSVISYDVAVTNNGNQTVTGLSVGDSFVSPAGPAMTINCPTTTVAPGATVHCTGTYTVTQADLDKGSIVNTATATGTVPGGGTVTAPPVQSTVGTSTTGKLGVTVGTSPAPVTKAGDQVTYTYTVTNTGTSTLSGVGLTSTFTAPAGNGTPVPASCAASTLAPGASTTCTLTYTATQADVDHGSITNAGTATGTDPQSKTVTSGPADATVPIAATPSLAVKKTASPLAVNQAGQTINYTFVVVNTGNVTVGAIAIADVFSGPAGPMTTKINCDLPTLAPNASTNCYGSYTVKQADIDYGSITNSATATGTTLNGTAVMSASSTATVTATPAGALSILTTANPTTVTAAGQGVTFTYTVTNTGNVTVNGVKVGNTLTSPAGPNVQVNPCQQTSLAPGASTTCTSTVYTVTQADINNGSITTTGTATGTDPQGNGVTSQPSSATVGVTQSSGLTVSAPTTTATITQAGQPVPYTVTVTNTGNTTLTNVGASDTLNPPAGAGPALVCQSTTLLPGVSTTCTGTYTTTQKDVDNGKITGTVTATGTNPTGGQVAATPVPFTTPIAEQPTLTLTKSASPATLNPAAGTTISYSFAVANTGNVTVGNLKVNDALAAPATAVLSITCPVTSLAPGGSTVCTAQYTVTQTDIDNGSVTNSATVSGTDPQGNAVKSSPSAATVAITRTTGLTLTQTASPTTYTTVGQTVTYTYQVTNNGNTTVNGLTIADAVGPNGATLTPTCASTTLAPGASTPCQVTYTVTQADLDRGSIVNNGTANGTTPQGAVASNPTTTTVSAVGSPGLTVTKSANPQTVTAAGQTVTYSFAVSNTGNLTETGIGINDPMFTGANKPTCLVTTLAPGGSTTCTATYTTAQHDIDNGGISNTATVSGATLTGVPTTSGPSTALVTATQMPALTVTKTATPMTVTNVGDSISYTITVTNTGNVTLDPVAVTDTLAAPAGPQVMPNCPQTSLAPGTAEACTLAYKTTAADFNNGSITNVATATGTPPGGAAPVTSTSAPVVVTAKQVAALSIVKTGVPHDLNGDGVIDLGDTISYSFVVTNIGTVTLTGVAVDDPLAGPVTTCTYSTGGTSNGTLAAGQSETCVPQSDYVVTQADVDKGSVNNTATVTGTSSVNGQPTSATSNTVTTQTGAKPALTLVKKGTLVDSNDDGRTDAGDQVLWTFVVTDSGNVTITNLSVADPTGGNVTCPVTTLLPGASTTCKANTTLTLTQADIDSGSVTDTATVSGTDPTGATTTSQPSTATVPLPSEASLTLVKSAKVTDTNGDGVTDAGDTVVWMFLVTNTGNVTESNIAVNDPTAGTVTCPKTTLAPDASMTCTSAPHTITTAEAAAGKLTNTATVTGTGAGTAGETVTSAPSTATVNTHGTNPISVGPNPTKPGGTSPVAYTGAKDLPLLVVVSLLSLLLGVMFTLAGLVRRRRRDGLT